MYRPKRPLSGPLVLLAVASALAVSNLACSKKEVADSWQMQPPKLEMKDSGGARIQLRASEIMKSTTAMSSLVGDESAFLQFAKEDLGLAMEVKSNCRSTENQETSFSDTLKTAEEIALISLLPTRSLTPEGLRKDWTCTFKLRVTNGAGSQQSFSFSGLKITFGIAHANPVLINAQMDAGRVRTGFERRLICSSWWTDSSNADLATMAHAAKVNGIDTRTVDRQPLCSVVELNSKAKLIGYYRPIFSGPHSTWNREVLIPKAYLPNLFHQPLLAWNIRNDDSAPQIFVITLNSSRVQLSGLFQLRSLSDERFWSRPTLARPRVSVEGALEFKQTQEGFYFRVAPGATVRVTMGSDRDARLESSYDFTRVTFRMLITTERPVLLQTLTGFDSASNLASASPSALDAAARDLTNEQDILLSNIVLTGESNTGRLLELNNSVQDALRWGSPMESRACYSISNGIAIPPTE
jgi:hypothetical protein